MLCLPKPTVACFKARAKARTVLRSWISSRPRNLIKPPARIAARQPDSNLTLSIRFGSLRRNDHAAALIRSRHKPESRVHSLKSNPAEGQGLASRWRDDTARELASSRREAKRQSVVALIH